MLTESTSRRLALGLIPVFMLCAGAALLYTIKNLGINTDTADMISETLPFRAAYERYRQEFPLLVDRFVVVIDGATPEQADAVAERLAADLDLRPDLFTDIYLPGAGEFFARNGFLYLDQAELEALSDQLIDVQPFIGRLNRDPSLKTLADTVRQAIEQSTVESGLPLNPLFTELNKTIDAFLAQQPYDLSWRSLLKGEASTGEDLRRYLLVKPALDFSEPLAAEPAMEAIRQASDMILKGPLAGVRVRITGDAALGYEELISAMHGAELAGMLALIMVSIILFIGLGSIWLVLAALLTLTTGLMFTAGFATVAIGHLNLISVAFAVLYIGLGVDYAIHLCLRYREWLSRGERKFAALKSAVRDIRGSLLLCTLTTAIGFYAFLPTAFSGVSELGLISGTGMFINLALSLSLLPACLLLLPAPAVSGTVVPASPRSGFVDLPLRYARGIRRVALALSLIAVASLPQLHFDRNPLNLRDQSSESVSTILELMAESEMPAMSIAVLAPDAKSSARQAEKLGSLPVVGEIIGAQDFLPSVTDEKLGVIEDLSLILGPSLASPGSRPTYSDRTIIDALTRLANELHGYRENGETGANAVEFQINLEKYLEQLSRQPETRQQASLAELRQRLLGNLPASIDRLRDALEPDRTNRELPLQIRERWINPQGLHRLAVYPAEDINDNEALRRFVTAVQQIVPDATDEPVLNIEAGDAVVQAFQQAFTSALVVITVLLLVLLRNLRTTVLVLMPLALAALLTMATMVAFDIPFNFANVIALPLLFGIGVDSSIHMVHRARHMPDRADNVLRTSTARAVWFSSLTTICSFGNLLFSPHTGTASMGLVLCIGISMTIVCTLVVLPALLRSKYSG